MFELPFEPSESSLVSSLPSPGVLVGHELVEVKVGVRIVEVRVMVLVEYKPYLGLLALSR